MQFNCWSLCQFNWKEICLHFWNLRHIGSRLFIVCWSTVPLDDAIRAVSSWCRIGFLYHNFYHLYYGGNEHEWYFCGHIDHKCWIRTQKIPNSPKSNFEIFESPKNIELSSAKLGPSIKPKTNLATSWTSQK